MVPGATHQFGSMSFLHEKGYRVFAVQNPLRQKKFQKRSIRERALT
jgi:hypothetical protein